MGASRTTTAVRFEPELHNRLVEYADATDFVVWGAKRDQVDGYGNAASPPVAEWISTRLMEIW